MTEGFPVLTHARAPGHPRAGGMTKRRFSPGQWASHGKIPWAANDVQNVAFSHIHWIGLRENLQETIDMPIEYGVFLQIFP